MVWVFRSGKFFFQRVSHGWRLSETLKKSAKQNSHPIAFDGSRLLTLLVQLEDMNLGGTIR
jgi:hypothetical protein